MGHGSDFLLETAPATPANGIQRCSTQSGNAGFKRGDLGTKIAQLSPPCAGQPLLPFSVNLVVHIIPRDVVRTFIDCCMVIQSPYIIRTPVLLCVLCIHQRPYRL